MSYHELRAVERATIQIGLVNQFSCCGLQALYASALLALLVGGGFLFVPRRWQRRYQAR